MRVCACGTVGQRWCRQSIFHAHRRRPIHVCGRSRPQMRVSDVYAMGGRPLTALAISAFPKDTLDYATLRQIFLGGFDKLQRSQAWFCLAVIPCRIRRSSLDTRLRVPPIRRGFYKRGRKTR